MSSNPKRRAKKQANKEKLRTRWETTMTTNRELAEQWMSGKLRLGPVRGELPDDLVVRIRNLWEPVGRYVVDNLEQWELGFMRDKNPESEVMIWEWIASKCAESTPIPAVRMQRISELIAESSLIKPITISSRDEEDEEEDDEP